MEFAIFYGLSVLWQIEALAEAAAVVAAILTLCLPLYILFAEDMGRNAGDDLKAVFKALKWPSFLLLALIVLTPSKDDLYFIAGGGLTLMAAQNEEVQKLPENAVNAVNTFLERVAEEQAK